MTTRRSLLLLAAALFTGAGCVDQQPLSPSPEPHRSASPSLQSVEGVVGSGARYALFVPPSWNGRLVLYAHGFVDPAEPIALPSNDQIEPLRRALLERGFAVAYSSYSENGLAVKDAAQRTHELGGIFAARFGKPRAQYLVGHSLGAVAVLMLAEKYPSQYAGALPMCGQLGGTQGSVDYVAHMRVLFDYFYPGVLPPGSALSIPQGVDLHRQVTLPVAAAVQRDPAKAAALAAIMANRGMQVPFSGSQQLVESLVRALGYNFRGFHDLLARTHGHSPFDNTRTVYASPLLPQPLVADLNRRVHRFASTPDAVRYLQRYYQPTGELKIPVLSLFNALDPVSPPFHEPAYRRAVSAAGRGHLLVQRRSVNPYGHCNFTVAETVRAFQDLVGWAEKGARPAG